MQGWKQALEKLRSSSQLVEAEHCELCAQTIRERHQHLIDPTQRTLICACDGCALLFDSRGATQYRRIPRDPRKLPGFSIPEGIWQKLLVPIGLAFFYRSSQAKKVVALYPSSAGVTESTIEEAPWRELVGANPGLATLEEDIEALLVNRLRKERIHLIAPIDRCFELVGLVKTHWEGFSGGDRVQQEIANFFDALGKAARE